MKKELCVGILRETRRNERRTPLTPAAAEWLVKRGIRVEVESSPTRIYKDKSYELHGSRVVNRFDKAAFLVGIKEPHADDVEKGKIYMIFSHTIKGQPDNMSLLKAFLDRDATLIDYEKIVDFWGKRLAYFGRFAGICGLVNSLSCMGRKLALRGLENPFSNLRPAHRYGSMARVSTAMKQVAARIREEGFQRQIAPFIIGITGHGRVSRGVQQMLALLDPVEVHPDDISGLARGKKKPRHKLYKTVIYREAKIRAKDDRRFYFEEYLENPKYFTSNMDAYLPYINMLIHTSYWDSRYPRLVPGKMIAQLVKKRIFRLEFIGDISCDMYGSIQLTSRTTSSDDPVFMYDPKGRKYHEGISGPGIAIMAVDNLPAELPRESSTEFSALIRDYVYQVAVSGREGIARNSAIPAEIRRAVIVERGTFTRDFAYLKRIIGTAR